MTPEQIKSASEEVERLTHKLDITNADHIALWLEANMDDSPIAWLACRIIEAHEATLAAREAAARAEGRREGIEEAAKVADASPFNNGLNDAPASIASAIRARLGKKP